MSLYLSSKWNIGTAMGELSSALLLTFFVLVLIALSKQFNGTKPLVKNFIIAILLAIVGTISMLFGIAVGNALSPSVIIDGGSWGLGLMFPPFAILLSVHNNAFQALPMILGFQLIGSIIGIILYIGFIKVYKINVLSSNISYTDGFALNKQPYKANAVKELIAQSLFITIGFFIFGINPLSQVKDAEIMLKGLYLSLNLFVLFFMFGPLLYFMLSPWISLVSLIAGHCFSKANINSKVKTSKKDWINFMISFSIQSLVIIVISLLDYYLRKK